MAEVPIAGFGAQAAVEAECAPEPSCDSKWVDFTAGMALSSGTHHAGPDQHVYSPFIDADLVESCPDGRCAPYFRHGRSATVRWQTRCVQLGDECVARVRSTDPFLVSAVNVGGAGHHCHGINCRHTCAFLDIGSGPKMTFHCGINGNEDLKPHADMTEHGDGVIYGTSYAANHDNSNVPAITIGVGYGAAGAGVTIQDTAAATYSKARAWAQGMGCNDDGKPYKLPDDGDGHEYPWSGQVGGNEQ